MSSTSLPSALLLAAGLTLGGWFVGHGFADGRRSERTVTVKGVSERDVQADLALWPLQVVATDNDLARAQARINDEVGQVRRFLGRHGIDSTQVELQQLDMTDVLADPYRDQTRGGPRYVLKQTVMVRSDHPTTVLAASQQVGEVVGAGVSLASPGYGQSGPTFIFTRLNDLKPKMIAEATAEARRAAEQFANDSRSALGPIHDANHGVFEILPRDQAPGIQESSQLDKRLRVVTTVVYSLKE